MNPGQWRQWARFDDFPKPVRALYALKALQMEQGGVSVTTSVSEIAEIIGLGLDGASKALSWLKQRRMVVVVGPQRPLTIQLAPEFEWKTDAIPESIPEAPPITQALMSFSKTDSIDSGARLPDMATIENRKRLSKVKNSSEPGCQERQAQAFEVAKSGKVSLPGVANSGCQDRQAQDNPPPTLPPCFPPHPPYNPPTHPPAQGKIIAMKAAAEPQKPPRRATPQERNAAKGKAAERIATVIEEIRVLLGRTANSYRAVDSAHLRHIKSALQEGLTEEQIQEAIARFIHFETRLNGGNVSLDQPWLVPKALEGWRVHEAVKAKATLRVEPAKIHYLGTVVCDLCRKQLRKATTREEGKVILDEHLVHEHPHAKSTRVIIV